MQALSTHHRQQLDIPIFAITGSNGKTTSKELISRVLAKKYKVSATDGNLNNHIGVPLTLLRLSKGTDIAVVEMGANHQGEIAALCDIALPTHGLICSIGKAHIEGFGGLEGVKKGKGELYTHLLRHDGTVFINLATPHLAEILADRPGKVIKFGLPGTDIFGEITAEEPFVRGVVYVREKGFEVRSNLIGAYNFTNLVNAFAVGDYFGVAVEEIADTIGNYYPDNNRSQLVQKEGYQVIMDAYNANPTSMSHAIGYFERSHEARKVLIIGDMFELGADAPVEHQAIVDQAARGNFAQVVLVGPLFAATRYPKTFLSFHDATAASTWWQDYPKEGSIVLLKGSRAMQLERIMGG